MELLIGALIAILTQAIKWVYSKIANKDLASALIKIVAFIFTIIGVAIYVYGRNVIGVETLAQIGVIWATSIGVYELVGKYLVSLLPEKKI
jgi:hypothetical protein